MKTYRVRYAIIMIIKLKEKCGGKQNEYRYIKKVCRARC